MLWLIKENASYQVTGCNLHTSGEGEELVHQVWIERSNGKSVKISESKEKSDVILVKGAIDFAIEAGHKVLNLDA